MQFCASYLLFTQNCGELSYQSLYSKIKFHDIEAIPREMLQVKLPCNYKSIIWSRQIHYGFRFKVITH